MTVQLEHCPRELQGFFGSDQGRGQCRLEAAKAGERTLLNYWLEYRDFSLKCRPVRRTFDHSDIFQLHASSNVCVHHRVLQI